jgi:methionine biosynthesis protein MetW
MPEQPKYHMHDIFNPGTAHPDEAHSLIMRQIPENSRVLELGCSSGYLSGYMEQVLNCRVTGLEFDPLATNIAAKRITEVYTVDLDAEDTLTSAEDSAPYDVLLAAAVLEHLKYPERLLEAAKSLLKPDALVIVSLPNIAYWQFRLKLLLGQFDYTDYGVMDRTHLRLYTAKTGRELLENSGYRVEDLQTSGSLVQQVANRISRSLGHGQAASILPNLFAYELIYFARPIQ